MNSSFSALLLLLLIHPFSLSYGSEKYNPLMDHPDSPLPYIFNYLSNVTAPTPSSNDSVANRLSVLEQIAHNGAGVPYSPEFIDKALENVPRPAERHAPFLSKKGIAERTIAMVASLAIAHAGYFIYDRLSSSPQEGLDEEVSEEGQQLGDSYTANEREYLAQQMREFEERTERQNNHFDLVRTEYTRMFGTLPSTDLDALSMRELKKLSMAETQAARSNPTIDDYFRKKYRNLNPTDQIG